MDRLHRLHGAAGVVGGVLRAMAEHQGASGGWTARRPERRLSWANLTLFLLPILLASRPLAARVSARAS